MAKSSHPSAQSRVSTPHTAILAVGLRLRKSFATTPKGKLPNRTPGQFNTAKTPFRWGDPKKSADLLAGRFNFSGQILDVDPWTSIAPSRRFAGWLHEFDWMHDLLAGGNEAHHAKARVYVDGWIQTYGRGNDFVSDPVRLSRRLFNWLALWSPTLSAPGYEDADIGLAGKARVLEHRRSNIYRQLIVLRGSLKSLPSGLPRLTAGCALALGGARIGDGNAQFLERGLDLLDAELPIQILPDGGHVSRSPEACVIALRELLTLDKILEERGLEGSRELSRAIDRLAPMVAFFRRSSGELAAFHGGSEMTSRMMNGTTLLIDTGEAPPRPYDTQAHLAPLAMDLSTEEGPMITGCGFNHEQPENWARPIRSAAAHSTLVLDGRSPGRLLTSQWKRDTVGDAVERVAGPVKATS